jgi:hypothetical protein
VLEVAEWQTGGGVQGNNVLLHVRTALREGVRPV